MMAQIGKAHTPGTGLPVQRTLQATFTLIKITNATRPPSGSSTCLRRVTFNAQNRLLQSD